MQSALLCAELSTLEDTVGIGSEVSLFEITEILEGLDLVQTCLEILEGRG